MNHISLFLYLILWIIEHDSKTIVSLNHCSFTRYHGPWFMDHWWSYESWSMIPYTWTTMIQLFNDPLIHWINDPWFNESTNHDIWWIKIYDAWSFTQWLIIHDPLIMIQKTDSIVKWIMIYGAWSMIHGWCIMDHDSWIIDH